MFASTSKALKPEESSSRSMSNFLIRRNFTSTTRTERSVFSLPSEDEEDIQFDTSDSSSNCEALMAGKQYPSIQEFASAIPNHLLLGSLLEHLCFVYERDPSRSHMLFKVIGQRLAAMNLLSPLAISDEFSTVRLQHNRAFTELLHAASTSLFPQGQRCLNTDIQSLTLRPKEGLFQAQTSRYLSEFEEISQLGRGSYGKVFKVTNKLDGQNYAVKKILIKNVSREDCMKVLREVKVLSSLQHPHVVGYHTAWMEHVQPNRTTKLKSVLPALESPALLERTEDSSASSTGSSIVFESSNCSRDRAVSKPPTKAPGQQGETSQAVCPKTMQRVPDNYVPCVFLGRGGPGVGPPLKEPCPAVSWDGSRVTEDESNGLEGNNNSCTDKDSQKWTDKHSSMEVQFHLMLYIQMQLCELSLKDWISERNTRRSSADPYSCVDTVKTLSILKRVLEGVEYLHSRAIMHRDLKPRNIFLQGHDFNVKIGDFGLACRDIIMDNREPLLSTSNNTGSSHTTGVGTFVYAAPEQREGSRYDSKSDMYSVGVVALELFQPFGTEMERVRTLEDLREGNVPESFCHRWPMLAKYVRQLTKRDPSLRPSSTQLLQSELFGNKDVVIHGLQRRVEEQEAEIVQLRRQISQLQGTHPSSSNLDQT
ncbi:eukaryotic translation initiation factor 2-alpha kinase 1 isoform X1 [Osmerus eperlanus]|uniref:eukaryotic translation initiation factor 2-alpha kinase 1 isoform X1 n=1 Tax=Osmerus eperlanus TaxID=29151 RepID=UPI002E0D2CBB